MFWNNLSFILAIYQKLADFNIDDVWFFAGSLEGFCSSGGSPLFWRVTQEVYEKCMKLSQIWVTYFTWVTLKMQDDLHY